MGEDGVITTSRICRSYLVEVCGRELSVYMFVIDTDGYDMILGMTWLSKYHVINDYRNKSVIFRILHQPEFQFVGESKASRQNIKEIASSQKPRRCR